MGCMGAGYEDGVYGMGLGGRWGDGARFKGVDGISQVGRRLCSGDNHGEHGGHGARGGVFDGITGWGMDREFACGSTGTAARQKSGRMA